MLVIALAVVLILLHIMLMLSFESAVLGILAMFFFLNLFTVSRGKYVNEKRR